MPNDKEKAFSKAERLLVAHGFHCEVSLKEFSDWLNASTFHPDVGLHEILSRPLLVAHEIAEISEVKRMGLSISKDVILKNPGRIYEAHLKAFEVEIALAARTRDWSHVRSRLKDVRSWVEDPLLPSRLKPRCRMLYAKAEALARSQR